MAEWIDLLDPSEEELRKHLPEDIQESALALLLEQVETGVGHSKGRENSLAKHLAKRLVFDPRDHHAHNVGRHRVIPPRTRRKFERKLRQFGDEVIHHGDGHADVFPGR